MIAFKEFRILKESRVRKGKVSDEWENTPEEKAEITRDRISEHPFTAEERKAIKNGINSLGYGDKAMNLAYKTESGNAGTEKDKYTIHTFDTLFSRSNSALSVPSGSVLYHGTNAPPNIVDGHHIRNHVIGTTPHFFEAVNHAARKKRGDSSEASPTINVLAIHHNNEANAVNISQHSPRNRGEAEVVHPAAKFKHIGTDNIGDDPVTGKPIHVHHFEVAYQNPRHNTYEENKQMGTKVAMARRKEFTNSSFNT